MLPADAPDGHAAVVAQRNQDAQPGVQRDLLDAGAVGLDEIHPSVFDDRDAAAIVTRVDHAVRRHLDAVGAHLQIDHAELDATVGIPDTQRAVDTGRHQPAPIPRPRQRKYVAGVASHFMQAAAIPVEDPHDAIERTGGDAQIVR